MAALNRRQCFVATESVWSQNTVPTGVRLRLARAHVAPVSETIVWRGSSTLPMGCDEGYPLFRSGSMSYSLLVDGPDKVFCICRVTAVVQDVLKRVAKRIVEFTTEETRKSALKNLCRSGNDIKIFKAILCYTFSSRYQLYGVLSAAIDRQNRGEHYFYFRRYRWREYGLHMADYESHVFLWTWKWVPNAISGVYSRCQSMVSISAWFGE